MIRTMNVTTISNLPRIVKDDNVGKLIFEAANAQGTFFKGSDIIVVAQKIISKAEGAVVNLDTVTPTERAVELAGATGRDPRLCQVYLDESTEVIKVKGRTVVTRHKLGFVGSGSGVDRSNVAPHEDATVVLLPKDPDASARRIRQTIAETADCNVAVIVNDSMGRPDREGSVGMAIGIAGIRHIESRQQQDLFGNPSSSTIALVDELAATASVLMGQADESIPVVVIRGVNFTPDEAASIQELLIN